MDAGERAAGRRRDPRGRYVALALALYTACALWATWPAIRHVDGHYLARPAPGHGEAAAGDHLQLGWSFWLVGHQLERGGAPWADPYSFRPEAEAPVNVQGWLFGLPYWPLDRLWGPIWAYNLLALISFVVAGGLTCWWLRALGLRPAAALAGGVVFLLMPYRAGQSTGHLLGLISFLLPGTLLALERRRVGLATVILATIPLSGQLHLALGAVPLALGYAWARLPRRLWWRAAAGGAIAVAAAVVVERATVDDSIATERSFAQVERYSAEVSDFVTRGVGAGVEELVFLGWLTPVLALAGLALSWRRRQGLAVALALAALVPSLLALGAHLPGYEELWSRFSPLHATRVPERLMPIACLALAGLVALALDRLVRLAHKARLAPALAAVIVLALAVDLRVPVFGAVAADHPSPAYAAIRGEGRLLELPVFLPDTHFGSAYLGYARQSPRERPLGYSTLAEPAADQLARRLRGLSCGRGEIPPELGVRFVALHRGLFAQSRFFGSGCAAAAEQQLLRSGWRALARDGPISVFGR